MDRLTVKSNFASGGYALKSLCTFNPDGTTADELGCDEICTHNCDECAVQNAFNRLGEYENIGLSPDEIKKLLGEKAERNVIK